MQRITELIGSSLRTMAAAVAGAIALVGCANLPADETGAPDAAGSQPGTATAATTPAARPIPPAAGTANATGAGKPPTKTVTLPPKDRISLAEYRAQMRAQLMKTDNAAPDVADCAAHASWVIPRSASYDALKLPTGALGPDQATVAPWEGRFSQGKQAVPVKTVVTFQATAHKRSAAPAQWDPIQVRCGYDDGMMLAYEMLDASGAAISEPAAAPAVTQTTGKSSKGSHGKSTAKSTTKSATRSSGKPAASSSKSTASKSTAKPAAKSGTTKSKH
jgi:hypothetical protein